MYTEEERKCIETLRNRNIRYTNELFENELCLDYFYKRGLEDKDIEHWRLGVVPKDEHKRRKETYLAGRLVFPLLVGKETDSYCIGMAYRSLDKDASCKYIFDSTDKTKSFKGKSKYLYGLNYAKAIAKRKNSIIITEGYMDAISMHKSGFINTVASMGLEISKQQIDLIKPITKRVYLFLDGDKPGIEAIEKNVLSLISEGLETFVISIKDGKDPAELCLEHNFNKDGIKAYIKNNCSIGLQEIIDNKIKMFESVVLNLQTETLQKLNNIISIIPDESMKEVYTNFVRKRIF